MDKRQEPETRRSRLQKPRPLSRDAVINLLKRGMGVREIAKATGATTGAVRAHMRRLEADGVVKNGKVVGAEGAEAARGEAGAGATLAAAAPAAHPTPTQAPPSIPESLKGLDVDKLTDVLIYALGQARRVRDLESRVLELERVLDESRQLRSSAEAEVGAARKALGEKAERQRRFEEAAW